MATAAQIKAVERLVHESVAAVDALAPPALAALLPALRQARDELRKDLQAWFAQHPDGDERFTAFQKKQALLSLEATLEQIEATHPAMAGTLAMGRKATGGIATSNLAHEVGRLSSIFNKGAPSIPQIDTAAIIAQGNRLLWKRHEASAARYAGSIGDDIKLRMSVSLAKGDTFNQMAARLRGSSAFRQAVAMSDPANAANAIADTAFQRWRHWADRLVRTENMHAYNVQHDLSIRHVNENRSEDDEEYLRRWDATADKVTCELCRELDQTLATIDGEFKGGIKSPPRHPYCRCVVLAWLARWGHFKGETPSKDSSGRKIRPAKDVPKAKPIEDTPEHQAETARRAKASVDAKKAAAEDLAAFDKHTADEKAKAAEWDAKVAAAKAKQANLASEIKAKAQAEKVAKEGERRAAASSDAKKAAAEDLAAFNAHKAKLAAEKAAKDAEAAKLAAEAKAKKQAAAQAAKIKKAAKLATSAAPFDPATSGTIGYIPSGKAKGKTHLLAKAGMVQTDANTIVGHGYKVTWDPTAGKWVTQSGPVDAGFKYDHGTQKWSPKDAPPPPAPKPIAPPISSTPTTPKPPDITGHEWKWTGGKWTLHKNGVPTTQLVKPYQYGVSPTLGNKYTLGGDLAKQGLVPTDAGVMEGHGYKFVKDSDGNWYKTETLGKPYKNPDSPSAVAQRQAALYDHPSGFKPMTEQVYRKATKDDYSALSTSEREGIKAYSGSSYTAINGGPNTKGLRNPPPSAAAQAHIDRMDKAFKNPAARMKQDAIVYRGVGGLAHFDAHNVGDVFEDLGFSSTSQGTTNAFYQGADVRMHISVPKGHPAIAMGDELSHYSNEKEILLPRGQKFRILKKEMVGGKLYMHVEVMPHAP